MHLYLSNYAGGRKDLVKWRRMSLRPPKLSSVAGKNPSQHTPAVRARAEHQRGSSALGYGGFASTRFQLLCTSSTLMSSSTYRRLSPARLFFQPIFHPNDFKELQKAPNRFHRFPWSNSAGDMLPRASDKIYRLSVAGDDECRLEYPKGHQGDPTMPSSGRI
jgi:hypothetical protein